jgi:predicted Zn-dependent protease
MTIPGIIRCEIRLAECQLARFRKLGTQTSLFFLLSLFSVAHGMAQDVSIPTARQQPEAQRVASPKNETRVPGTAKKSDPKYDVGRIGQHGIGSGMNLYSLEREREIGHELAEQMEMRSKLISDPEIVEYVDRLGQRIVRNSDAQVPFTIKVIDSNQVSSVALPGGYLYVDTGLIMAADNEAELAGLMAHEIAHVAARHFARANTQGRLWSLLSGTLYIGSLAGAAIEGVIAVAAAASAMRVSRDDEREADLLGLEYEYAAGYDPQQFVEFFEKLHIKEKHTHNLFARAFASRPKTEDRIRRAQKEIATLLPATDEYIVDTSEFEEVKSKIANLMNERLIREDERPVLHLRHLDDDSRTSPN